MGQERMLDLEEENKQLKIKLEYFEGIAKKYVNLFEIAEQGLKRAEWVPSELTQRVVREEIERIEEEKQRNNINEY